MSWEGIVAIIVSAAGSIAWIANTVSKWVSKAAKYEAVAKDGISLIDDVLLALAPDPDGKITLTTEEVAKLEKDVNQLKVDFANAK